MEYNQAYSFTQVNTPLSTEATYNYIDQPIDRDEREVQESIKTGRKSNVVCGIITALVTIVVVLTLVLAVVAVILTLVPPTNSSNQEIQTLQLEKKNLRLVLNQTETNLNSRVSAISINSQRQDATLLDKVQNIQTILQELGAIGITRGQQPVVVTTDNQTDPPTTEPPSTTETLSTTMPPLQLGSFENPAATCKDIPPNSLSGEYWIQTDSINSPVQVYCDMNQRNCSCNSTGGWTRVANLDMTDPSQQCPNELTLVTRTTAPLRTCGRTGIGCISTAYPSHGIEYTRVCGRVIGYQYSEPEAFLPFYANTNRMIDDVYVDGVSLTHGQSPRKHIWTFANAEYEQQHSIGICPCTRSDVPFTGAVPPFIGQDYFCATGSREQASPATLYANDPLWDGQGCEGTSTCCEFNNPPWFCKQLPQSTTDNIELRLCGDSYNSDEDSRLEIVQIYIQ